MRDTVFVHPLVHLGSFCRRDSQKRRQNEYRESLHGNNARGDRQAVPDPDGQSIEAHPVKRPEQEHSLPSAL